MSICCAYIAALSNPFWVGALVLFFGLVTLDVAYDVDYDWLGLNSGTATLKVLLNG